MPHPISHISSVSPAQSLHSATDSPVSSASPEPSALGSQEPHLASNQPPQTPDSALPTASVIDAEDPPAEGSTSSTTDSEAQANKKKTHKKSNRYANQPKAKAHISACAVGGITLGILAGPIGLVFAAAYINAMCGAMYGGSEYFTGDKAKHPKTEPEPQPENTPPRHRPNPNSVPSEEGRRPDESDTEQGREHVGQPNATIGSNNFIFAPTNIFAPTTITSPTTTEGNVYFFREDDKNHKSTTEQKTSSTASQTNNSSQGFSTSGVKKVVGVSTLNRQQATADKPASVAAAVEEFFDSFDGDTALHVRFDDGVNAFVHAPESMTSGILTKHSHLLNRPSSTVVTTGKENDQTDTKEVQHPKTPQHHRADGFDQMLDAQITHSQNSARLVANEEKPSIGKNGTHSWQLQQQGSWELKSIDSVNAKTVQQQGFDRADGVPTSSGSAFERLDMELKKRNPQPFDTLPITPQNITEKLEVMRESSEKVMKLERQYSKPLATKELTVETSSNQWTKEITENGQSRWVKPKQSSGNDKVLLTGGAVSGLGQNYTQGIRNNLKPLDELKMAHFQQLKKNIKNNNEATRQSVFHSGGLVVAGQSVSERNLIRASN
ncbi:hypothetical protein [Vibrio anguillarum]|uniref:hypothetical protein n=1 Tax=Vibrio anguillarum TaxID=55601 RepID=UPI00097E23C7|nr:hypothetical protein [Vibrio anguillarum]AQM21002.1 hypothetical protein PN51_14405 [Vibrio anguillarum]AUB86018.1 hypothetical protein CKY00_01530 [Vibrio anguillarum]AUB89455.1 hypothetical protein CKX99_01525 [Vibrio anguillarum]AUB92896.1 hypothetical protein CK210_01525 [Vibrio anguillarum]AUB96329.1 hypothetical protein CK209_01525 [Vibrio anguillarum]